MPSDVSMSASPAGHTPGHTPGETPGRTPNCAPLKVLRKKRPADPLVRRKDVKKKPPPEQSLRTNGAPPQQRNGLRHPVHYPPPQPYHQQGYAPPPSRSFTSNSENAVSGFSSAPIAQVRDYPLILSKRAITEGFRHHVARFSSKKMVDPRNPEEFVRPVRLHRKDPKTLTKYVDGEVKDENGEDSKEMEAKSIAKAEKDAEREIENAKVAPSAVKKKSASFKKTEQVYRHDLTEEQKAKSKLRYEESLPWCLEDFDGKSAWVSTYEDALSNTYSMLVQGPEGFRLTPLEKWYKFSEKPKFAVHSAQGAENLMKMKVKQPRWFMDTQLAEQEREKAAHARKIQSGLFVGKWEKGGGGSGEAKPMVKHENADADDLDFVEDRFADDEENMVFEEDEETKEAQERIKKDQMQANVFNLKEEKEYEKQEELEKKEEEAQKLLGKEVRKRLKKREKNYIYESDDDSSDDSTDTENRKAEGKAAKEKKDKESGKDTPNPSPEKAAEKGKSKPLKTESGRATPSGRPSKQLDSKNISRQPSFQNLKRAVSPNGSDASGNESTRSHRKPKKNNKNLAPSSQQLQPPSRPGSPPAPPSSAPAGTKRAAGSDAEGSGGEMSDGAKARKRQKLKLTMGGSPNGSGAGSPDAANAPSPPASTAPITELSLPSPAEIRAKIPAEGISIQDLLKQFPGRVQQANNPQFTSLVKANSRFDRGRKVLLPL